MCVHRSFLPSPSCEPSPYTITFDHLSRQQSCEMVKYFETEIRPKFSEAADQVSSQVAHKASTTAKAAKQKQQPQHRYAGLEFTEDPFRNYRYEDPFNISDPFDDDTDGKSTPASGAKLDPFGFETDSGFASEFPTPTSKMNGSTSTDSFATATGLGLKSHTEIPPEDQQLAWAAAESLRLEEERRKRLEQEQADLEYALALSREEKSRKGL